ncbi:MAG: response regulator, partial [Candidatus Sedimenticola endophacoides]
MEEQTIQSKQAASAGTGNILVVDDTPASLRLLTELLTDAGFKVRPSNSGTLALQSAQAQPPNLILLDIRMPDLDGYEVYRRLKAEPATADVPVIFISALDDVKDRIKGFEVGGVDYISKPFQREEVLARVHTHMELRRMRTSLEEIVRERSASLENTIRTLRTLSAVNQSLIHASEEQPLLESICNSAVNLGGYRMAWVGYLKQGRIVPRFASGHHDGYLEGLGASLALDQGDDLYPAARAVNDKQLDFSNDIASDPEFGPWREQALARGYRSSIALPLIVNDECIGALSLYSTVANRFSDRELLMLDEMANDLAFGIKHLRLDTARHIAQEERKRTLEQLRRTLEQTIEAMAITVEKRDPYTAGHQHRVTRLAVAIAEEMGLDESTINGIRFAGSIHDTRVSLPRERFWDIPVPKIDSPTRQPLLPRP